MLQPRALSKHNSTMQFYSERWQKNEERGRGKRERENDHGNLGLFLLSSMFDVGFFQMQGELQEYRTEGMTTQEQMQSLNSNATPIYFQC